MLGVESSDGCVACSEPGEEDDEVLALAILSSKAVARCAKARRSSASLLDPPCSALGWRVK